MSGGKMENYFTKLNAIDCNSKVEEKNGLKYLSWSYAWGELKKVFPDATYTVYENKDGLNYHNDGKTCWVKTGVTVNGLEHIEYLPVMDYKNRSIPLDSVTSFDVNKAIQRCLTKAIARHGLGLYIYAGEDLPEVDVTEDVVTEVANIPTVEQLRSYYNANKEKYSGNSKTKFLDVISKRKTELEKVEVVEEAE